MNAGDTPERYAHTAGDRLPPDCVRIEVRVTALQQLFNVMDASPFRERDLDPNAEEFIVGWAREAPRGKSLGLLVELGRAHGLDDEPVILREAIRVFFTHRAAASRARLRQLLKVGRISLVLGLCFLIAAVGLGRLVAGAMAGQEVGEFIQQGLSICGWVAMWRPLEIFLYGWWPIRSEAQLFDKLSTMPVQIAYAGTAEPDAWRRDWPALPPQTTNAQKPHHASTSTASMVAAERGPVAAVIAPEASPSDPLGPG